MGSVCQISIDNDKSIGDGGNDSPPLDEAIGNAYLIAAAPDLYAIVEKFSEYMQSFNDDAVRPDFWILEDWIRKCHAALAKARGE